MGVEEWFVLLDRGEHFMLHKVYVCARVSVIPERQEDISLYK